MLKDRCLKRNFYESVTKVKEDYMLVEGLHLSSDFACTSNKIGAYLFQRLSQSLQTVVDAHPCALVLH